MYMCVYISWEQLYMGSRQDTESEDRKMRSRITYKAQNPHLCFTYFIFIYYVS